MKNIAVIFILFTFLMSCNKKNTSGSNNNPNSSTENILNSNAFVVDTTAITSVTNSSLMIIKSNTTLRPRKGDILLAAPTASNPYGFLRKVLIVTENANQIVCTTEQSNLNDAFAQLNISINYVDTFSSGVSFRKGSQLSVKFQDDNTIANGIRLNGEIIFNIPSVKIEYTKKKGSLLPEKVLIQADFDTDGSTLEITNTDKSAIQIGEKILTDFPLPVIRVPIPIATPFGIILFPIPFSQKLVIKSLPISISGKAKWVTLPKCSATLGVKYENSNWTNLSTFSIDASAPSLSKGNFTPSVSLSAKVTIATPEYEIYPYKIEELRAFFAIPNSMDLTLQTVSPNYSLKYKLDVTGGIKQEFFTGVKQEYSITGNVITKTLFEGDWATTFPVVSTTGNASSITQTTAVSGGLVLDDGGSTVTARGVCWSTTQNPTLLNNKTTDGTGPGPFTSTLTGLTPNTTYFIKAYAINSLGTSFGNEVSFTTSANPYAALSGVYNGTSTWSNYQGNGDVPVNFSLSFIVDQNGILSGNMTITNVSQAMTGTTNGTNISFEWLPPAAPFKYSGTFSLDKKTIEGSGGAGNYYAPDNVNGPFKVIKVP